MAGKEQGYLRIKISDVTAADTGEYPLEGSTQDTLSRYILV